MQNFVPLNQIELFTDDVNDEDEKSDSDDEIIDYFLMN
jgi:hypothetical protein